MYIIYILRDLIVECRVLPSLTNVVLSCFDKSLIIADVTPLSISALGDILKCNINTCVQ